MVDRGTGGEDHLDAAAPDVDDGGRPALEVEMAAGGTEGELGFFVARDHLDVHLVLPGHFPDEAPAVGGFAHRAGCDGPDLVDFEAVGNRLHLADRRQCPLNGFFGEPAGPVQPLPQPYHLPLLIQDPVSVVLLHFRHGQTYGVGANVNSREARGSGRGRFGTAHRRYVDFTGSTLHASRRGPRMCNEARSMSRARHSECAGGGCPLSVRYTGNASWTAEYRRVCNPRQQEEGASPTAFPPDFQPLFSSWFSLGAKGPFDEADLPDRGQPAPRWRIGCRNCPRR